MSGGLDSALAIRLLQEQGVQVIGVSCTHPFHPRPGPGEPSWAERSAQELGIELIQPDVTREMLEALKNPPHGFGRHLNPCIDCRLLYIRQGAKVMERRGARFIITGEVLGQRPMSQRRDAINIIDRDSGLSGLILRPLSAKLLAPTVPEEEGWVDRDRLLALKGRSRKPQMELARELGLTQYSSPAGGCLLTMEDFARKTADLLGHGDPGPDDVELLKLGRHFRLSTRAKLVLGKNREENQRLVDMAGPEDALIMTAHAPGPLGVLRGSPGEDELETACAIMGRYVRGAKGPVAFSVSRRRGEGAGRVEAAPMGKDDVKRYMV